MNELYSEYIKSCSGLEADFEGLFALIGDIYHTEEIQGQAVYLQHAEINRLEHVTSVTYLCWYLAQKYHANVYSAAKAAVLHDLVYYDWHEPDWSHRPHGYRHPGFAVKNAKALCGSLSPIEENAIHRHMWPLTVIPPRYREGWLLTIADKYCAFQEMKRSKLKGAGEKFRADVEEYRKTKKSA